MALKNVEKAARKLLNDLCWTVFELMIKTNRNGYYQLNFKEPEKLKEATPKLLKEFE